jgi:RNA polymerase sigma-B factor
MANGMNPDERDRIRAADARLRRQHRRGDQRARERLIVRYLPLALGLARRYSRAPEPMDDLYQVAAIGLVKAVDRWDPDRGLAFSSYAVPTILGELRRYFRDSTWFVRPPRAVQELSLSLDAAHEALSATIGREPTIAELAERVDRTPEEVAEAMLAADGRSAHSLDAPLHADDTETLTPRDAIGHDDPAYGDVEARATLERLTSILDPRAREILRLRFEQDLLQYEIAAHVGVSQMHVSRILRASLDQLRAHGTQPLPRAA